MTNLYADSREPEWAWLFDGTSTRYWILPHEEMWFELHPNMDSDSYTLQLCEEGIVHTRMFLTPRSYRNARDMVQSSLYSLVKGYWEDIDAVKRSHSIAEELGFI